LCSWLLILAACGASSEGAPKRMMIDPKSGLCVTKGSVGTSVTEPTVRAVKPGSTGDSATLTFIYRGDTDTTRSLASGKDRRQIGLKLRAANGCNLIYVMWRIDPKPMLDVSVKLNPGARTHEECGAKGYTKLKPVEAAAVPVLAAGAQHVLHAEIHDDELRVYIDDAPTWRGRLPASARALAGPAGLRSDNLAFDLVAFDAPGVRSESCSAADSD
jgi:hypothetical protein